MTMEHSKNGSKHNGHSHSGLSGGSLNGNGNGSRRGRPVLITGGAGFIGTNLAHRLLSSHRPVLVYDNLSRPGVEQNLEWLRREHGNLVQFEHGDVRDPETLRRAAERAGQVFHFAAQVAVTASLTDPIHDFEINARGTLNLLEALRSLRNPPPLIFTSTNKVYGNLNDVALRENDSRYEPDDAGAREFGFNESRPIHFHSPYGCSKGAAEQYVLDFARTFGLRTAVFRMSCIYGLHQFGTEDQGWVAHFLIRALEGLPITIYGDGRQVRDVLFADDLISALLLAMENIGKLGGEVFNIGGGPLNTTSLLELLDLIGALAGRRPEVRFDSWRTADQQYYVSDTRKFSEATGWRARVGVRDGVAQLREWLKENRRPVPNALKTEGALVGVSNGTNGHRKSRSGSSPAKGVRARRPPRLKHRFSLRNGKRSHSKLTKAL